MKKIWTILAVSSLLAGCSMYSVDETQDSENDQEEQAELEEAEVTTDINFSLQESDRFAQVSPLNDDGLRILSDYVIEAEADQLAPAGELAMDYSGVYLSSEDSIFAIYLLTNRTNVDMMDLQLHVSHQTSDGEVILEEHPIYLGREMFGILSEDTAMPVYIEMASEEASLLDGQSFGTGEVTIDNLVFDTEEDALGQEEDLAEEESEETTEAEETDEEENSVPEGFNLGYHPSFVLVMRQEQELLEDIQAGNVPELSVEVPPVLANHIQGGEIMNMIRADEIVHPASGFSQEGQLSLFWTGITTGEYESTIFLLANRTGEDLSDFSITVDFLTSDGGEILSEEELAITLTEYGTVPSDSLMPIMVDVPAENRDEFARLLDPQADVQPQYQIVDTSISGQDETEETEETEENQENSENENDSDLEA